MSNLTTTTVAADQVSALAAKYRQQPNWQLAILSDVQSKALDAALASQIMTALTPKQSNGGGFSMKVGEKGGVTIRGIKGASVRFGLTMYVETLEELFARQEQVKAFIVANNGKLSRKVRAD